MKKTIISFGIFMTIAGIISFTNARYGEAYSAGPPAGATGSPYDGATCDYPGCHSTYPLQGAKPGWITSNVPGIGYVPGQTYTLTAKAVYIGRSIFGFEISPQDISGNILGTLSATNNKTQLASGYPGYAEQTYTGRTGTDSVVWNFNWTAPNPGKGNITFYGAFNCANGDATNAGDYIYTSTLTIPQDYSAGINELNAGTTPVSVYPNPVSANCHISYLLSQAAQVEINLYSLDGRKAATLLPLIKQNAGNHQQLLNFSGISQGVYLLRVKNGNNASFKKVIVQ